MTKPYLPPTLIVHGHVSKLTAAGAGGVTERHQRDGESQARHKRPQSATA